MREIYQTGKYAYVFSTYDEPVATVQPGETVILHTCDAFENTLHSKDQLAADLRTRWENPEVGPIIIEGAEPGDTLKVHIIHIEPERDYAWSCLAKNFGGLVSSYNTPMLNEQLDEKTWVYELKDGMLINHENPALTFEWEPFLGTIATAPEKEAFRAEVPFELGGNMDVPDVKPGNIVYLPVRVPGAYFFTGDVHAKQGHGEICGSAIEINAAVTLKFELIKGKHLDWPRIESPDWLMCVGNAKPLVDAARIAYIQMLNWMVELGWDRIDGLQCMTQVCECYLGNLVDPNYSMVVKMPKEYMYRCMK